MELYSAGFLLFLAVSLASYYLVGRLVPRGQWALLLVASLAFYGLVGSWETLWLVVLVALVTWAVPLAFVRMEGLSSRQRHALDDRRQRKAVKLRWRRRQRLVLLAALVACFGILAYLKYWNTLLYELGAAPSRGSLGLLLPLGISFYTFQSVAYLVDAYNAKVEPQRNFARHLLFVTWFPQMIQGPINRYDQLGPQLFAPHRWSEVDVSRALVTVGYGMVKKFVMADLLVGIITRLLSSVDAQTPGSLIVLAILMYSAQQYGDFSGGIDMVEGVSELFGVHMAPNFRRPYFSTSLADFWRRWHISLGQWMRDYVFYPFALTAPMKRLGKWSSARLGRHVGRTLPACVANVLVFLIVGIWHGADLHFVVWGLYNGLVIALSDLLRPAFDHLVGALRVDREGRPWHVFAVLRTFAVVNVGWYFDRIEDFGTSVLCLKSTLLNFDPVGLGPSLAALGLKPGERMQIMLAFVAIVVVFAQSLQEERRGHATQSCVAEDFLARPVLVRGATVVTLGLLVLSSFVFNVGGGFMYANY